MCVNLLEEKVLKFAPPNLTLSKCIYIYKPNLKNKTILYVCLQDFASPNTVSPKILEAMESGSESRMSTSINVSLSADIKPATVEENLQVSIHRLFYLI